MEKLVSRSLMLILIGMATAQNIQAGERMSMPTSFKKQTTGLSHVSQQTISVKGNVRDQSGEPMAGVNVIVEGTTIGTMTESRLLDMEHKRKLQSRGLYLPLELKIF